MNLCNLAAFKRIKNYKASKFERNHIFFGLRPKKFEPRLGNILAAQVKKGQPSPGKEIFFIISQYF